MIRSTEKISGTYRIMALIFVAIVVSTPAFSPLVIDQMIRNPVALKRVLAWWKGAEYLGIEGVIRQSTPTDCGVACLQMVFQEKGINAPAEAIRRAAGTTSRGTSILGLQLAARHFGLEASAWVLSERDFINAPRPLIALVNDSHFVVVSSLDSRQELIVLDPSLGKLRYELRSFRKRWRGEAIIFLHHPCN